MTNERFSLVPPIISTGLRQFLRCSSFDGVIFRESWKVPSAQVHGTAQIADSFVSLVILRMFTNVARGFSQLTSAAPSCKSTPLIRKCHHRPGLQREELGQTFTESVE